MNEVKQAVEALERLRKSYDSERTAAERDHEVMNETAIALAALRSLPGPATDDAILLGVCGHCFSCSLGEAKQIWRLAERFHEIGEKE